MISVIFCCRVMDNSASMLGRLLDSTLEYTTPEERQHLEFLIKYDDDDDQRHPDDFFAKYPLNVRRFVYSRGDGRHSLHHAQEYLFANRDPRSRFCLMTADDFYFTRPNFVTEILSHKEEFLILGHNRPPIESFAGIYEKEEAIRRWVVAFGEWSPVVSSRLIEVCQNFGWQANVDSWLMGLSVVLYDLYKIILWQPQPPFYFREGGYGLGGTPTYNNMEINDKVGPLNRYWFELVRRQARNIYLNMEYGTAFSRVAWHSTPKRLCRNAWKKVRAQPLTRLPGRVCHRLMKEVRMLLA